ncbi:GNAT family N-acetyltransferase [Roseobacter sp. HKCCD9010]|uniref:GNAT family N-acetyltransferase n=1 Tax=unclassified Roseobacter TaxID=196798 RepID=UPI00149106CE|nr:MULTISPECIES: GNAT family N-acetyltransferase [unclassified Roseobacter]MBF9051662.1 GNAT family N-acetyltransferase [Rhodobacterales bacterium HKCCD4356]NNV13186.1 GNAT family N-acetyltransferase [Roseobacter sp. HKCCD7357]NNV17437.1 GNAT family N-acetyltransferase [Roseobacter sp. HKCCD8768]NNV27043.1 GNAT family N-acetyltransferase [Roseobacter sp. HKCCD8192]NNV31163.1 GNAT family N-acetyltransferase [Roseobacter sp. HKCCD9061]
MIRPYSPADKQAVMSIWRDTSAVAHPFLSSEFMSEAENLIRDTLLDMAEIWVAEQDGTPVGFVALIGHEVGGLFLRPEHHGHGIGQALMDRAVQRKGGLELDVFRENTKARQFYTRYGLTEGAERFDDASGQYVLRMTYTPA